MNAALEGLTPKVTATMNDQLNASFTAEEISEALFQMCPTKAPGPDGLNSMFFQKHWQHVGKGVTQTCLHILNNQGNLSPLNHTFIALIPKVAKPRKVTEYRPISLCNVVYRIVAKVIANRLKQVLHQIISPYQSAFVPNRIITDNIVIGYECLHKIRHSKGRKNELVSLKLDISKVYDRVEWGFLEHIMRRLGFIEKWVHFVFTKASVEDCRNLKAIFDCYAAASGQIFNYEKSSMFCSGKLPAKQITAIKNIFQLKMVSKYEKYLGLPSMIGRKKMSFFNEVKLKVLSKISKWQNNFFSSGGKEVLIKAVAQAVPAYAMSVFKLPLTLCEGIQKAIAKFWEKVKVYRSNWLPRPTTFRPISPRTLAVDAKVAELISPEGEWKRDMIQQNFIKEDAEIISRIPQPRYTALDELCWHYDKLGKYLVKSGYQIALKEKFPSAPSSSNPDPK
ncbi:uncharacterized protein LOC127903105 [Citrus sinensis]|uniref:uncharacterized protein LOC127903105 n=1 Tax=Citrus sinensis TaxID=2711 RepID=UPI0022786395|nr:uncharacterized protein LOC127903105 [Citrus sinensis]